MSLIALRLRQQVQARLAAMEAQKQRLAEEAAKALEPKTELTAIAKALSTLPAVASADVPAQVNKSSVTIDMLNVRQRRAIKMAAAGHSFVTTGPAGSGKTTVTRFSIDAVIKSGRIGNLPNMLTAAPVCHGDGTDLDDYSVEDEFKHKYLKKGGPSIAVISYTNVATNNIKAILPAEIAQHCMTAHKFLEYTPEDYEVEVVDDEGYGSTKTSQRFVPKFGCEPLTHGGTGLGHGNLLPHFDCIIIEESGTMPLWLMMTVISALPEPEKIQFIFLGDIEQLAPAFGDGILGYKMLELPRIELNETYRNVGLVTKLAHRILTGKAMPDAEVDQWKLTDESGSLNFLQFKQYGTSWESALLTTGNYFRKQAATNQFDPDKDMILVPFNVKLGTQELGRYVAQGMTDREYAVVTEVIAGFNKFYFCEGDRLFINKGYYELVSITPNEKYSGAKPRNPSRCIDRWGRVRFDVPEDLEVAKPVDVEEDDVHEDPDTALEMMLQASGEEIKEARLQASHVLEVRKINTENNTDDVTETAKISTVSAIRNIEFSYALTVFKAQGSEFQRVFFVLHSSHSVSATKEQLYTAVTRARKDFVMLFDGDKSGGAKNTMITKSLRKQAIPGMGIEEKLNYFRVKCGMPALTLTEIMKLKYEAKQQDLLDAASTEAKQEAV